MLVLLFNIENMMYGIKSKNLIEVIPYLKLAPIPNTPKYILGSFNYRGTNLAAFDLNVITSGKETENKLSSKILIVNISYGGEEKIIGFVVRRVNEIIQIDESELIDQSIVINEARFIGKMFKYKNGLVQLVNTESLLNEEIKQIIFTK